MKHAFMWFAHEKLDDQYLLYFSVELEVSHFQKQLIQLPETCFIKLGATAFYLKIVLLDTMVSSYMKRKSFINIEKVCHELNTVTLIIMEIKPVYITFVLYSKSTQI